MATLLMSSLNLYFDSSHSELFNGIKLGLGSKLRWKIDISNLCPHD